MVIKTSVIVIFPFVKSNFLLSLTPSMLKGTNTVQGIIMRNRSPKFTIDSRNTPVKHICFFLSFFNNLQRLVLS